VAVDLFLSEQEAQRALEECWRDEPDWHGLLRVEEIVIGGPIEPSNWSRREWRPALRF